MAIAVSAITTLLTPWLIRVSPAIAAWIDRKLPRSLQTFAALYASWLEQLSRSGGTNSDLHEVRRAIRWLIVDAVVVAAIVIGASVEMDRIAPSGTSPLADFPERNTQLAIVAGRRFSPRHFGLA